jgi:rhodanese-related sulfurtransferase
MSVVELNKELGKGLQAVLLDVQDKWEYDICHIDGSINISLSDITVASVFASGGIQKYIYPILPHHIVVYILLDHSLL